MTIDIANSPVYKDIFDCFASKDIQKLHTVLDKYNLHIVDGKIIPISSEEYKNYVLFWNQRQQATKILLNSLYGALLNESMKFYDKRIGQSVTLTGRCITKHMTSQINEQITGVYDVHGESIIYNDTDSVHKDTVVMMNDIPYTIAAAFDACEIKWSVGDKEYACDDRMKTYTYDPVTNKPVLTNFNYIYRHLTSKEQWMIVDVNDNCIKVTNDHSCVVVTHDGLQEIKPTDMTLHHSIITYAQST
jgi:DNA polymerase family B